jgi:hypothetical protein
VRFIQAIGLESGLFVADLDQDDLAALLMISGRVRVKAVLALIRAAKSPPQTSLPRRSPAAGGPVILSRFVLVNITKHVPRYWTGTVFPA